jgi:hypothetical protein
MIAKRSLAPQGTIGLTVIRRRAWLPRDLEHRLRTWQPRSGLGGIIRSLLLTHPLPPAAVAEVLEAITRCVVIESRLRAVRIDGLTGRREDYGIVSQRVITDAGVAFLVDAWQNLVELENLRYHGIGTGATAESASQTALVTELTTQYNPDNTRATGTLTEGASANIFRSVGTNTLDSGTPAVTEHGLFSQAATGGGTLWDRSVFSAINLNGANGDGLQTTYDMTASAGG